MNYNVTNHAIMRYLQRKYGVSIINDRTFEVWKRASEENEKEVKRASEELKRLVLQAEIDFDGDFNNKKTKTKYFININDISIICVKEENIITYYSAEFENFYSKETNKKLLKALVEELIEKEIEVEELRRVTSEGRIKNNKIINETNEEIKIKKTELQVLEEKLKKATSDNSFLNSKLDSEETILNIIKRRCCRNEIDN